MYLYRVNNKVKGFVGMDFEKLKEDDENIYKALEPYLFEKGNYVHWMDITEDVGYWRKANEVHNFFVEKAQNGVDNCREHEVPKEVLEDLLDRCKEIITAYKEKEDDWQIVAEDLLPTQDGFFFGSTDYDDWYIDDIDKTITIISKVLNETDFDTHSIFYCSSW